MRIGLDFAFVVIYFLFGSFSSKSLGELRQSYLVILTKVSVCGGISRLEYDDLILFESLCLKDFADQNHDRELT